MAPSVELLSGREKKETDWCRVGETLQKIQTRRAGYARPDDPADRLVFAETMIEDIQQFHCVLLIAISSSMLCGSGFGNSAPAASGLPYASHNIRNCLNDISPESSKRRIVASGTPLLMLASLRLCFLDLRAVLRDADKERWMSPAAYIWIILSIMTHLF